MINVLLVCIGSTSSYHSFIPLSGCTFHRYMWIIASSAGKVDTKYHAVLGSPPVEGEGGREHQVGGRAHLRLHEGEA